MRELLPGVILPFSRMMAPTRGGAGHVFVLPAKR